MLPPLQAPPARLSGVLTCTPTMGHDGRFVTPPPHGGGCNLCNPCHSSWYNWSTAPMVSLWLWIAATFVGRFRVVVQSSYLLFVLTTSLARPTIPLEPKVFLPQASHSGWSCL